jgi:hypothetical protein
MSSTWQDYKIIAETPNTADNGWAEGWATHPFDENWSDTWWPRRAIQCMIDTFYELYPTPAGDQFGYSVVIDCGGGAYLVGAVPAPKMLVRVTGPLHPDAVAWARDKHPDRYVKMVAETVH